MRFWIISDAHLGKYGMDSDKWLNNMRSYFFDFFIPILEENARPQDKLFFLGDLFDNRNSIDMRAITLAVEIFEALSKIIECHVLLGNHDQRMMTDPTVNSVVSIRNIDNVIVYDKEKVIQIDDHKILIMPWVHGKDTEKTILEKYSGCDLLFCHSDLNGCRTQLYPTRPLSKSILDIDDFAGYDKIYSGHIHIVQEIQNFTFVGSPYHLDRNDVSNRKGIFVYNTKTRKDKFIENDFSPEFVKIDIFKEKDLDKLKEAVQGNNFIDIYISNNLIINKPHVKLDLDKIVNKHKVENIYFIDDVEKSSEEKKVSNVGTKSIKEISFEWTDKIKYNDDLDMFTEMELKNKMKETIEACFDLYQTSKK